MRITRVLFSFVAGLAIWFACGGEKFPLPEPSAIGDGTSAVDDTLYIQLSPIWGPETNATIYDFDQPRDILVGREPFIYVADSGNDRIVMLDLAGNLVGVSQTIENPIALTQDPKLRLLIVTDSNTIYRIDLVAASHDIGAADPELVF
ncbi:hypothetical protein MJD09_21845, partial [bacterium]|nr:hypothetical protein [bacterium]